MTQRKVITRTRTTGSREASREAFVREMVPVLHENGNVSEVVKAFSLDAWEIYKTTSMPTKSDEAWRRTDLKGLRMDSFHIPTEDEASSLEQPPNSILEPMVGEEHGGQVVLSPQGSQVWLEHELAEKGVIFTDLTTARRENSEVLEKVLGKVVKPAEGKFAALAAALSSKGILVYVPKGLQVEKPLHSLLWGPGDGLAYFSHILVFVDNGASLTYMHESASHTVEGGQGLHSGIVEVILGENANLRFVELQSWGEHVWNFTHERAIVSRDANFDWIFGAIGSRLTKNFSEIDLTGQGAVGKMSGFYFTEGNQHLDHDTQQNHYAPNTTSDLLFKGALKDNSRSVWQGMIYVAPGAQKTDGYQANRNLVLSSKARADSIPGLEILADDVRCTHGATVGKIDPDQVFYLRSRGIPIEESERLIVEGFFDPIMQRIPFEGVRSRFQHAISEKLG